MNRRGFLGFFGAGAVAGPKLAPSLLDGLTAKARVPLASTAIRAAAKAGESIKSSSVGDWRLRQIAHLKRIISGKDPDAERNRKMHQVIMAEDVERVRLDGLRSVSPGHKMRMLVNSAPERQERIRRADAGFDLARLLSGED